MKPLLDNVSFEYVLTSWNVDGEIYRCDIERWLNTTLPREKREEVRAKLMELRRMFHDQRPREVAR
jgi:hypothetical protein